MAYCRFGNSDAYILRSMASENWICCSCRFHKEFIRGYRVFGDVTLRTPMQVEGHMLTHLAAGHRIPVAALRRIRLDIISWYSESANLESKMEKP